MKYRPLADKIFIKREVKDENTSAGGIVLQGKAEAIPKGEVVAIGTGEVKPNGTVVPMPVAVGDKVLFGAYAGTEIDMSDAQDDSDIVVIMASNDIIAIID